MIRYYKVIDGVTNISNEEQQGWSPIDFGSDEQAWLDGGCPSCIIWENDLPRLKNDNERKADLLPFVHQRIDENTDRLIFSIEFDYVYDGNTYTFNTAGKDVYFQQYQTLEANDYPKAIKAKGDNYCTFAIRGDHWTFIRHGASLIENGPVHWGRCLKYGGTHDSVPYAGIYNMTLAELLAFVDPRI